MHVFTCYLLKEESCTSRVLVNLIDLIISTFVSLSTKPASKIHAQQMQNNERKQNVKKPREAPFRTGCKLVPLTNMCRHVSAAWKAWNAWKWMKLRFLLLRAVWRRDHVLKYGCGRWCLGCPWSQGRSWRNGTARITGLDRTPRPSRPTSESFSSRCQSNS